MAHLQESVWKTLLSLRTEKYISLQQYSFLISLYGQIFLYVSETSTNTFVSQGWHFPSTPKTGLSGAQVAYVILKGIIAKDILHIQS